MAIDINENTPSIVIDSLALTLANRDALIRRERKASILTYVNNNDYLNPANRGTAIAGTRIY